MKWVIGIVVVVIVGLGIWWYVSTPKAEAPAVSQNGANTNTIAASNTSNSGIAQDVSSIDTQIQGLNGDSQNTSADANASSQTSY